MKLKHISIIAFILYIVVVLSILIPINLYNIKKELNKEFSESMYRGSRRRWKEIDFLYKIYGQDLINHIDKVNQLIGGGTMDKNGNYVYIANKKGILLVHPSSVGKSIATLPAFKIMLKKKKGFIEYIYPIKNKPISLYPKIVGFTTYEKLGWIIGFSGYLKQNQQSVTSIKTELSKIIIIIMIFVIFFSYIIGNIASKDLVRMSDVFKLLKDGIFNKKIFLKRPLEFKQLSENFNIFISSISNTLRNTINSTHSVVDTVNKLEIINESSNKTIRFVTNSSRIVGEEINKQLLAVEKIQESEKNEKELLKNIEKSVDIVKNKEHELEDISQRQASAIEEISATIEEQLSNIKSISDVSEIAHTESDNLLKIANKGNEDLIDTEKSISEMVETSNHIIQFIDIIKEVASQTNLLAMNAAIEAAHAGQKSWPKELDELLDMLEENQSTIKLDSEITDNIKILRKAKSKTLGISAGFAVVAEEIRKLADKSNKESNKLEKQIKSFKNEIVNVDIKLKDTTIGFQDVVRISNEVADVITKINTAMNEQNTGSMEMTKAVLSLQDTSSILLNVGGDLKSSINNVNDDTKKIETEIISSSELINNMSEISNSTIESMKVVSITIDESKEKSEQLLFGLEDMKEKVQILEKSLKHYQLLEDGKNN